ncbi:hypothetical protein BT69DRAFT_1234270, partial [Atractiella rhizophila]
EEVRPCDVFDLICGTSTVWWIGLMLRKLGITVRQSISEYEEIVQDIFSEGAPLSNEGDAYSKKTLEAVRQESLPGTLHG